MTVLQGRTRRWLLLLTAVATAAACRDTVSPRETKVPTQPALTISDGAHNNGNNDVFFLPPMVANPAGATGYGDPFAANLPVMIRVVCIVAPDHSCDGTQEVAKFLPGTVKMDLTNQMYMVNWDTKASSLNDNNTYQIQVWVNDKQLAYADVDPVSNASELKNLSTQDTIGLVDGRTLPIKVRIEQGWACADRQARLCATQIVGNTVAGSPITVIAPNNVAAGQFDGNWIPYCTSDGVPDGCVPQGTQVVVTIEDQTALLNEVPPNGGTAPTCSLINDGVPKTQMLSDSHCVKFTTNPEFKFAAPVKVAVCVHSDELTQQLIKYDVDETPRFLENVPFQVNGVDFTALCEQGETQIGSRSSNSLLNSTLVALSKVGRAVGALFAPRLAYAIHTGVGGLVGTGDGFSYVAPGRPLTLSVLGGDQQAAAVGSPLASAVQVKISTVHGQFDFESGYPNPLYQLPVQCSIDKLSGSFPGNPDAGPPPTQITVMTDANGVATCPSWILGSEGTNTLHVTAPHIDGGIIAVEDVTNPDTRITTPQSVALNSVVAFHAQGLTTLVSCNEPLTGGDLLDRGFYLPQFPGSALGQVVLHFNASTLGTYTIQLTALSGSYDGATLGTAVATVPITDAAQSSTSTFSFAPVAVTQGSTVAFKMTLLSGPTNGTPFFVTAPTVDGDPTCPVVETDGTSAPLDTFRRQGIAVQILGSGSTIQ